MGNRAHLSPLAALVTVAFILACSTASPGQQEAPLEMRLGSVIAQFFGVPLELLAITSVEDDMRGGAPVYNVRATVLTPDRRMVGEVRATVDHTVSYVTRAGRVAYDRDDALRMAEEFARANFPGWSDRMVLTEPPGNSDPFHCRWDEKDGDAWTGSFVALTSSVYRPGAPETYSAYRATPGSADDVKITAAQAQDIVRTFLAAHGQECRLGSPQLHLDDLNWHLVFWRVPFQARLAGAEPAASWMEGFAIVDAVTGEVVEPKLDE